MSFLINRLIHGSVVFNAVTAVILFAAVPVAVAQMQAAPTATAVPTAAITTGQLNVREGPGVGYLPIATLAQGDDVELLGRNADSSWIQVRLASGTVGWISSLYIETNVALSSLPVLATTAEPYAYVSTGRLNMRTGPGTTYPIVFTLTEFDTVSLLGRSADGNWLLIRAFSTYVGWANAGFIGSSVANSTLPTLDPAATTTSPPLGAVPVYGSGIANTPELNVYQSASITSPVVRTLPSGTRFSLAARDATTSWVRVVLSDGVTGWVNANSIEGSIALTDLPVQ